jgi:Glucosamine 6-phosphate synthetase, contains amidotransferase and phosphosugar isomerase domains
VVVVSFSGKTGRTIEAAHQARAFGHLVIALTGVPDSPIAKVADCVLSAEIPTFGFSPGTSTYTAMLVTLLTLAAELGATVAAGADGPASPDAVRRYATDLQRLPRLAEETLRLSEGPAYAAAERLAGARMITFLGAGPNEASAKFGAAKLFEGAQQIASRRTSRSGRTSSTSSPGPVSRSSWWRPVARRATGWPRSLPS